MTHTEPRSSVSSSPKHCRNWPTRRRLVTRHRCHFVKHRLRLATQTTIELVRIEKNGECKVAPKPVGNAALAGRATALERLTPRRTSTKDSSATARIKPNEICCHPLEARLLADCSGGNSRLSYLLGCGGRSFFDQENALRDRTNSAVPDPVTRPFSSECCDDSAVALGCGLGY
jgi:hypothetical protein